MKEEYVRVNLKIKKEDLEVLKTEAEKYDCSLSNYLLFKANIIGLPKPIITKKRLTVDDIIREANKLGNGQIFSIPNLFVEDWEEYSKTSRLSASKEFKKVIKEQEGKGGVFIDTTSSNLARYQKKDGPILYSNSSKKSSKTKN